MPRYAITANFDKKEIEKIDRVCDSEHCSKYKLLRSAVLGYVEAYLDEEKQDESRREGKNVQKVDEGSNQGKTSDIFDL